MINEYIKGDLRLPPARSMKSETKASGYVTWQRLVFTEHS